MAKQITVLPYSGEELKSKLAMIAELAERMTAEENKVDADTVYDDTEVKSMIAALADRLTAEENKVDVDTVYDDTEVLSLIDALTARITAEENKEDADTVYDDTEVKAMIAALAERLTAEENKTDNDTVYDDTALQARVSALETDVAELKAREDSDTIYDDTEVKSMIAALADRLTAEENKVDVDTVYDDTEVKSLISALTERVAEVEGRTDNDTLYDDTEVKALISTLSDRLTAVEESSDADTIYDDSEILDIIEQLNTRVAEVEAREDSDTLYDDAEVRGLITELASRVSVVESREDSDTIYDDTEVKALISALAERMTAEENKVDADTVYNDTEVRGLIAALAERMSTEENKVDLDTIYDDTEVKALISALTERISAEENKADADTIYDDTELQAKYDSLNTKYNELFDFVYNAATPEQATIMNPSYVMNAFNNGETSVEITNGELGDVTIPETTKGLTVEAPMQDDATITLTSPKFMYLNNTSDEPVSVTFDAPEPTGTAANTTIYAGGEYDTITLNNASLNVNSKLDELQVENIVIENTAEEPKSNSVTAVFVGENPSVSSETATSLTINNKNATSSDENVNETPDMTINAPNATVTLNNSWDNVSSTVGDNTLMIGTNTRINKLTVLKGNVIVKDTVTTRCINQVVNETEYTVDVYRKTVMDGNELNSSLINNCGYTILGDDITRGRLTWGVFGSGNYVLDLNGHTLTISDAMFGLKARNTVNLTIIDSVGTGKLISDKSYGLWAGENTTITIDVPDTTEIIGVTHTLYCEGSGKPTINVLGGTFKMLVADGEEPEYDVNGNWKFMVNHYDATFTREGNCFNITGGKFYGFNPKESYAEPGSPVNLLGSGYDVTTTQEDGVNVYTVVAVNP